MQVEQYKSENLKNRVEVLEKLVHKLMNASFGDESINGNVNMYEVIMNDDLIAPKVNTPEWDAYQETFDAECESLEKQLTLQGIELK